MNDKLYSAISLCRKAGKLKMGSDVVKENVQKKAAELVLVTTDLSPRSRRNVEELCVQTGTTLLQLPYTMEQLTPVSRKKVGIYAVCDKGFAQMMKSLPSNQTETQPDEAGTQQLLPGKRRNLIV